MSGITCYIFIAYFSLYAAERNETYISFLTYFTVKLMVYERVEEKICFAKNSELAYSKSKLVSRIHAKITEIFTFSVTFERRFLLPEFVGMQVCKYTFN
jgi:hypothetical protein